MPFPHSQDRAPPGTDATTVLFKAFWAFNKCLRKAKRKKGREGRRKGGKERGREEETVDWKKMCLKNYNREDIQIFYLSGLWNFIVRSRVEQYQDC